MTTQVTTLIPLTARPLHERVAAVVRGQMSVYGVTQTRLAAVLGVTQQTVSAKKAGKTPFTLDELELIAPMFGMEADELLRAARDLRPIDPGTESADYTSAQVSDAVIITGPWASRALGTPAGVGA